jgi:hypothetical protein
MTTSSTAELSTTDRSSNRSAIQTAAAERRRRRLAGAPESSWSPDDLHRVRIDYRTEWEHFVASQPSAIAAALEHDLAACRGTTDDDQADAALADIVSRARTDVNAARTVLRRILPGLVAVAGRRCRISNQSAQDVLHEVVATAWIAIRSYPIERRPRRIASNLVRDAEYLMFVRAGRMRHIDETDFDGVGDCDAGTASQSAGAEVIALLADGRRAGVDADGLNLLGRLALTDISVGDLATELACTPRTILNRRRHIEGELRAVAHADFDHEALANVA